MERIEVNGLRVAYRRAGSGPALVLVHGGLGDSRDWRRQLEGLGDEFTVVAWDAPGCGGSGDAPASYRLPDYADCLAGFVAARYGGRDAESCLRFAVACGAESTQHFGAGRLDQRDVDRVLSEVRVEALESPAIEVG